MPLQKLGGKEYYLGIFFKVKIIIFLLNVKPYTQMTKAKMRKMAFLQANWYKAEQYCRFHGMHLASINSEEEQRELEVGQQS